MQLTAAGLLHAIRILIQPIHVLVYNILGHQTFSEGELSQVAKSTTTIY
jgi:hypothetical protein